MNPSSLKCAVVTALLVPLSINADWNMGDVGVDHMYNDLTSFNVTSVADCAQACNQNPDCTGWVVTPQGTANNCGDQNFCYLKSAMGNQTPNVCRISGFKNSTLLPPAFFTVPVGNGLVPTGWLYNELQVQAKGMLLYVFNYWPDIANSSWIGGTADGGLHERAPYALNGLVPASYLTQDPTLGAIRDKYINYIIDHQLPSGWLGIDDMPTSGDQYWSRMNILLSLIQYYEATQSPRAMNATFLYLSECRRRMMNTVPLQDWAAARGQDFIMALWWLVDNFATLQGVPEGYSEAFLIDLADLAHQQMIDNGADWKTFFDTDAFPAGRMDGGMLSHGVNIGQALKSETINYRRSHDLTDIASSFIRVAKLDQHDGVPSGMFQADEHLSSNMPSHGTETCAVIEAIVSYAVMGVVSGEAFFFEKAERVAYNAMPATGTKDLKTRVYLQQSNEIFAIVENPHVFYTDGGDSATYSLEGNYGCCTANAHAGLPKFAQRAVGYFNTGNGGSSSNGVAVFLWAPVNATTPYGTISVDTEYPFGDTATVTVVPVSGATAPTPVLLRIPAWATGATLSINNGAEMPLTGSNGTFYTTSTVGTAATTFVINFNPEIRLETYYNGAVTVLRGALVYSVWIGQNISVTTDYGNGAQDLAITQPAGATPWNIALVVQDRSNPGADFTFTRTGSPSPVPFNSTQIPISISGTARVVNNWGIVSNAADAPPASPACATAGACGSEIPITLVPMGSTHIRMTVLPTA